jgi:hypothetical protein
MLNSIPLSTSFAQSFTITPVQGKINSEKLPPNTRILFPEKNKKNYLSSKQRDKILGRHFKQEIQNFDEVDRDILYKTIISYKDSEILQKYPFISKEKLEKIKNEFK